MNGLNRHTAWWTLLVPALLALPGATVTGQLLDPSRQGEVGLDPKLGEFIDLNLQFYNEANQPVRLGDLIQRPTVLTLVYYRCPGICTPLLNELASTVDKLDLVPGQDYQLLTISFDPRERDIPNIARNKRTNLLGTLKRKVEEDAWHFLTGDADAIQALTRSVGFKYVPALEDFTHVGTVIFLTKEGKIVSYLDGGAKVQPMAAGDGLPQPQLLPMEMKLAILDATAGRPRTLMKKIQTLCWSYDPVNKGYVLAVDRVILGITVLFVAVFGGLLLFSKSRRNQGTPNAKLCVGDPEPATAQEGAPNARFRVGDPGASPEQSPKGRQE
jgi:protein SCO1/2